MSDTKWGFECQYAHRAMPNKWSQSSGFSYFPADPLTKGTHRHRDVPFYQDDSHSRGFHHTERSQSKRWNMSVYGVHSNTSWNSSLRSPRNPFPGMADRETKFKGQPTPPTHRGNFRSAGASTRHAGSSILSARGASPLPGLSPTGSYPPGNDSRPDSAGQDSEPDDVSLPSKFKDIDVLDGLLPPPRRTPTLSVSGASSGARSLTPRIRRGSQKYPNFAPLGL